MLLRLAGGPPGERGLRTPTLGCERKPGLDVRSPDAWLRFNAPAANLTGIDRPELESQGGGVQCVEYTHDGWPATAGRDNTAKLWDGDGKQRLQLPGFSAPVLGFRPASASAPRFAASCSAR